MRVTRIAATLTGLLLALASCSGESEAPGTTQGPAGEISRIEIVGLSFEPSQVTLTQGGELTVTNSGSVAHTFTMDDGSVDESLDPGGSITVAILQDGGFHCEIHPSMTGEISF